MLYDRFDDMRSKGTAGGSEGYDLTKIGTSVSVQAQTPIVKGSKWVGIENSAQTLNITETTMNSLRLNSPNDLSYTFTYNSTGAGTSTTFPLYFYDLANNQYVEKDIDISQYLSQMNINTSNNFSCTSYINENGTLMTIKISQSGNTDFTGNDKVIIVEIDKENQSFITQMITLPFSTTSTLYFALLSENDVFFKETPSNSSIRTIHYYKYDFETHEISSYMTIINQNSTVTDEFFANTSMVRKNNTIIAMGTNRVIKVICGLTFSLSNITMSSSFPYLLGLEKNMDYVICATRKNTTNVSMAVVPFDYQNMTLGTPISISNVHTSNKAYMLENRILMYDSIYSFNGSSISVLATSTNTNLSELNSSFWNGKRWGYFSSNNSSSNKIFSVNGDSGNYLISTFSGLQTESNKYYGIASSDILIGDTGNAQLLFSTNT